jgi:DNA-directed RNA polymerase subunit RPC12/RpoP
MGRKYLCDNCGAEFDNLITWVDNPPDSYAADNLWKVAFHRASERKICLSGKEKEVCAECKKKLEKIMDEGW